MVKRFRNGLGDSKFKPFPFQDCRQGEPDIGFIVNKQEPIKLHQITFLRVGCKVAGGGWWKKGCGVRGGERAVARRAGNKKARRAFALRTRFLESHPGSYSERA